MPVFMNRIRPIARRVRRLTTRQNIALVASALLGVAIVVSAATGWQSLATALIGLTAMLALIASIQLRRRLAQNGRELNVQMKELAKRFDVAQRRILASVENERLMGADRQSVLWVDSVVSSLPWRMSDSLRRKGSVNWRTGSARFYPG